MNAGEWRGFCGVCGDSSGCGSVDRHLVVFDLVCKHCESSFARGRRSGPDSGEEHLHCRTNIFIAHNTASSQVDRRMGRMPRMSAKPQSASKVEECYLFHCWTLPNGKFQVGRDEVASFPIGGEPSYGASLEKFF